MARVSRPTALRYMKELDAVGLAWTEKKNGQTTIELRKRFTGLCKAPRLRKAKRGEGGKPRA